MLEIIYSPVPCLAFPGVFADFGIFSGAAFWPASVDSEATTSTAGAKVLPFRGASGLRCDKQEVVS